MSEPRTPREARRRPLPSAMPSPTLMVLTASTRPGRVGPAIAKWFLSAAHTDSHVKKTIAAARAAMKDVARATF